MMNNPTMRHQKGAATLFVSVIVLVIMTLVVIYAARVGLLEQRISANDVRYKEAFAIADGGLDYSTQLFASEFQRLYDGTDPTTSTTTLATIVANASVNNQALGGGLFTVTVTDTGSLLGSIPIYTFQSVGTGADGTGSATIQRQITMSYIFGGTAPDVPIIVGGAVGTGGNFNVVANPNGGGDGVALSVWSNSTISTSSSSATCHMEFYDGNNAQCSNPSGNQENITRGTNPAVTEATYNPSKPDLLPNDPNFPTDLFNFVFGMSRDDYMIKKNEAAANGQLVSNCSSIVAAGTTAGDNYPLWWVDGDCSINGGTIGTETSPIILVIEDHEFGVSGNSQVNGIVYLFDEDPADATEAPSASMSGTTEIQGSFISDVGGAAMSGSYSIVYNPNIINAFSPANGNNYSFSYVPASWRDF
jgi:hypothetical protein